ncbi:MAG TPA: Yip1 family protein, partial [Phenylobacterium sp.]|uniref:Yip1 family protein n=1 Tax=Phenylobacterium sp. TaxID=1871053 RepID=UPI002D380F8B
MTAVGGTTGTGLVGRVTNILTKPASEWDVIDTESASIGSLYTGYACILAAIPALASIVGGLLFLHWGVIVIAVIAVLSYVAQLVGVFISAFVIDALAPSFGGQKSQIQALKLVVYAQTAAWVAGVANIIPGIGGLIALAGGIYS